MATDRRNVNMDDIEGCRELLLAGFDIIEYADGSAHAIQSSKASGAFVDAESGWVITAVEEDDGHVVRTRLAPWAVRSVTRRSKKKTGTASF